MAGTADALEQLIVRFHQLSLGIHELGANDLVTAQAEER